MTPTRDRILDASIELFATRGFKATTVTDIEAAAGLTPGAGGLFHHFASKRALLTAAIERRFDQVEALNQIRSVIPSLGDRRAELRLFARYLLDQHADERDLLTLVLCEARNDSSLFGSAVDALFVERERAFACWLAGLAPDAEPTESQLALARMAIGALAYGPTVDALLRRPLLEVEEPLIEAWVDAAVTLLERA
jgi:AcrR family transcriptional regulator